MDNHAFATTYKVESDLIGEVTHYTVQPDDNLYAIARRFDVGIVELLAANPGVDPWLPSEGADLEVPTIHVLPAAERRGIVINLPELRLFYFPDARTVMSFPIGIGREGWQTPVGRTKIVKKREHPVWIPPSSIRKENPDLPAEVPAGPDNPMGEYALNLEWERYAIHGTNHPQGVGRRASHGCIRLYPEDIASLFSRVKEGTPVTVIDASYKLGWKDNTLWLEVTPTQQQADEIADYHQPEAIDIPDIHQAVEDMAGKTTPIDWYNVDKAVMQRRGIPIVVAQGGE